MLVPSFDADQDEDFVILTIRVPYVKISDAEIDINGKDFKFYCKPYYLWLQFSGLIVEDGREKAKYDVDTGNIVVHVPKETKGEHFVNLGMLTTLLAPRQHVCSTATGQGPTIEVLQSTTEQTDEPEDKQHREEEDSFTVDTKILDWTSGDTLKWDSIEPSSECKETHNYGFLNKQSGVFLKLQEEIPNLIDCPNPDQMSLSERTLARIAHEISSFNPDHYLADLMDDERIVEIMKYQPLWHVLHSNEVRDNSNHKDDSTIIPFSDEEKFFLKNLPNKEYLIDPSSCKSLYLGLIDILLAYAYDHRTTEGEATVESAWTITKLSPTLSWMESHTGCVSDVVLSFVRRVLAYPLYRHWTLALTLIRDVQEILQLGRRKILQCLIAVHDIFNSTEPYYILNNLYIKDYCVWIQQGDHATLELVSHKLNEVAMTKDLVDLELEELEAAAHQVLAEDGESDGENGGDEGDDDDGESGGDGGDGECESCDGESSDGDGVRCDEQVCLDDDIISGDHVALNHSFELLKCCDTTNNGTNNDTINYTINDTNNDNTDIDYCIEQLKLPSQSQPSKRKLIEEL